jgi:hypothetical protein
VLLALTLSDAAGRPLSQNLYWPSRDEAGTQALNTLKPQSVHVSAHAHFEAGEVSVQLVLEDAGTAPALAAKLTLVDEAGQRILPAYYSDNYLSLLPGEPRQIEIRYARTHAGSARVNLRGWNIEPLSTAIEVNR